MDRLIREGNPPVGQLASPVPQYKRPGSTDYEAVEGQHGAPFAILKDASGNVVSPATDAKLEQVKSELELVKSELQTIKANQLSGDQKVQLSGTKVELLKEWSDTGLMSQVEWFYGNNRTDDNRHLIPVNYSAKPRKMILVRNLFDVAVACRGVFGFKDGTTQGAIVELPFAEEVLIGANASALLTSETVPELDYNFPGIALSFIRKGMPTTGTLNIWFFGGDNQ